MSFYYTFQVTPSLNTHEDDMAQLQSVGEEDLKVHMTLDPLQNNYKFSIYPANISVPVETLVSSISKGEPTFYADDGIQYAINEPLSIAIKEAINNLDISERYERPQTDPLTKAKNKRRRRERKTATPPRPSNCFMLYRQKMWKKLALVISDSVSNTHISKFIGAMWKMESGNVRREYEAMAQRAVTEHGEKYPGYKYQPAKPKEKKKPIRVPKSHQIKEYSDGSREEVHTDIWRIPHTDSSQVEQQSPTETTELEPEYLDIMSLNLGNTTQFILPYNAEFPTPDMTLPYNSFGIEFPSYIGCEQNLGFAIPLSENDSIPFSQWMEMEMNNVNSHIPPNPLFWDQCQFKN